MVRDKILEIIKFSVLNVLLTYFIRDNNRCTLSILFIQYLFNLINGFEWVDPSRLRLKRTSSRFRLKNCTTLNPFQTQFIVVLTDIEEGNKRRLHILFTTTVVLLLNKKKDIYGPDYWSRFGTDVVGVYDWVFGEKTRTYRLTDNLNRLSLLYKVFVKVKLHKRGLE